MNNLPPPSAFTIDQNDPNKWPKWRKKIENYIIASDLNSKTIQQQRAILLHIIGDLALEIYNTFGFEENAQSPTIKDILDKYDQYFRPFKNTIYKRYLFFTCEQKLNQTFDDFVTEIKSKAEDCEFENIKDSLIRDRIVLGCRDTTLREKYLQNPDLTLSLAINQGQAAEASQKQLRNIEKDSIDAIRKNSNERYKPTTSLKNSYTSNPVRANFNKSIRCSKCNMAHDFGKCPAYGKECYKCRQPNHFANCCKNRAIRCIQEIEEEKDNLLIIDSIMVGQVLRKPWKELIYIQGHPVDIKLDTGADVNILPESLIKEWPNMPLLETADCKIYTYTGQQIPVVGKCLLDSNLDGNEIAMLIDSGSMYSILNKETYLKYWKMKQLSKSNVSLRTWASDKVKILGKLNVMAKVANCTKSMPILVAGGLGPNILGRQWFGAFHLKMNFLNLNGSNPISPEFEELFKEEIDAYNGPLIHIDLPENAVPKFKKTEKVLLHFKEAGLRLKRNKCKFYVPEIEFLGMKIDNKGIHPSEEKLRAIKDARPPSNKKELMSFLGLLNYYESCDVSEYGIGAILSQVDHGVERPVVFTSRTLNKTERRYAVINREALVVIFAESKFYQYLLGRKFKILTDHKPLIGLFNPSKPIPQVLSPRMLRWCLTLSAHSYSIEYKPGRTNGNVDALSRLPLNESPSEVPNPPEVFFIESEHAAISSSEVANRTKALAQGLCWWPNMDKDIERMVSNCRICLSCSHDPPKTSVYPWIWPSRPWSRLHIDHAGPFQGKLFLVAVDAFSKWTEAKIVLSTSTETTIKVLREMFATHGLRSTVVAFCEGSKADCRAEYALLSNAGSLMYCQQAMDKEEKLLEATQEALIIRGEDIKRTLSNFILKLENEVELNTWPLMLDHFALLSGQINSFMKVLKNDKTPQLRNRVFIPLLLNQDRDPDLAKLTENRVQAFNHEVVPDYLRTKPDPELETRENQVLLKASQTSPDTAQKQLMGFNKIVNSAIEIVKNAREEWESESSQRSNPPQTSSLADTTTLLAAVSMGKNLRPTMDTPKGPVQPPPQAAPAPRPTMMPVAGGKLPSSIKTNIKAAVSQMHPYNR
ncbi:K02A2.6-like [Cordylochernes scorpioides]|uniref:RNA-directed DNA polymerase n=1 Tax=Cordylochernes scorpioides TaxID=51811 RepID=A0ABY6KVH2_9ARAC|nr:K02A2.6-like [Cordylochernes scorpioides]